MLHTIPFRCSYREIFFFGGCKESPSDNWKYAEKCPSANGP